MEPTSTLFQPTPEDGCKAQQPKRCEFPSQQDEEKSPNNSFYNSIPSSTNLRKKVNYYLLGMPVQKVHPVS